MTKNLRKPGETQHYVSSEHENLKQNLGSRQESQKMCHEPLQDETADCVWLQLSRNTRRLQLQNTISQI